MNFTSNIGIISHILRSSRNWRVQSRHCIRYGGCNQIFDFLFHSRTLDPLCQQSLQTLRISLIPNVRIDCLLRDIFCAIHSYQIAQNGRWQFVQMFAIHWLWFVLFDFSVGQFILIRQSNAMRKVLLQMRYIEPEIVLHLRFDHFLHLFAIFFHARSPVFAIVGAQGDFEEQILVRKLHWQQ